ncbi:MAG: mitomycin resistance protein [Verrucomicrobiaceae bacterium]|nr:MAG: mitomycin resistance protein [Verrucomicrobiaceae bacterium]
MKIHPDAAVSRLDDLPNIGRSIAADLRALGIHTPADFARRVPLDLYEQLTPVMGHRHDPCVLYTFLSVAHFQKSGEKLPWWKFTDEGKRIIGSR